MTKTDGTATEAEPTASLDTPAPSAPPGRSAVKPRPPRGGKVARKAIRAAQRTIVLAVAVGLWEVLSRAGALGTLVPPPSRVMVVWSDWVFGNTGEAGRFYSGTWVENASASGIRVLKGFVLSAILGITIGILIGWFRTVGLLFDPLVQFMRPIPVTAWVPFTIVIFGLQDSGAVFLIFLGAFFPIVLNTTAGARQVSRLHVQAALMLGTPRRKLLWRVVLPSALPSIFTGLRLGVGVAWVLVVVAEMVAVRSGLGFVMWSAYQQLRMDVIVATMVSIGLLGFISDWVIVLMQRRLLAWSEGMFVD
jgi:NitT/TauT family transport system permease protein